MRICIPTNDNRGMASTAATHFGTAPFFTVVDLDTGAVAAKPNPSCHDRPSSCHHLDQLLAQRVDTVVCSGIGRRALLALEEAGIDVLYPPGAGVGEILDAVRSGRAPRLRHADACTGGERSEPGSDAHQYRHRHGRAGGGRQETRT